MSDCITRAMLLCAVTPFLSGCILPLIVFPAPQAGSGQRIRFVDSEGKPIRKDFLLVSIRNNDLHLGFCHFKGKGSAHVVSVSNGTANLPEEFAIASLWFCWAPPFPPMIGIYPGKNVELVPFLPGYFCKNRIEYDDLRGGTLPMESSENAEGRAQDYWSFHQTRLNTLLNGEPLPLSNDDLTQLNGQIEHELERLRDSPNECRIKAFVIAKATQYIQEQRRAVDYKVAKATRWNRDRWLVTFESPSCAPRDRISLCVTDEGVIEDDKSRKATSRPAQSLSESNSPMTQH